MTVSTPGLYHNKWIDRLFDNLLAQESLHVPSLKKRAYRSKITYGLPLADVVAGADQQDSGAIGNGDGDGGGAAGFALSPLAEDSINQVCTFVDQWSKQHLVGVDVLVEGNDCNHSDDDNGTDTGTGTDYRMAFREIMVKSTPTNSFLVRVTIEIPPLSQSITDDIQAGQPSMTPTQEPQPTPQPQPQPPSMAAHKTMEDFARALLREFDNHIDIDIQCVAYNVTYSRARATKSAPLFTLLTHLNAKPRQLKPHVMQRTPAGLDYQISPDTFAEANYEVELLQIHQKSAWVYEQMTNTKMVPQDGNGVRNIGDDDEPPKGSRSADDHRHFSSTSTSSSINKNLTKPPYKNIMLCSGRDISCFGLCFGTLKAPVSTVSTVDRTIPPLENERISIPTTKDESNINNNESTSTSAPSTTTKTQYQNVFEEMVVVQHCPLVNADACVNYYERHTQTIKATVLHSTKATMVQSVSKAVDAAMKRHGTATTPARVMVVTTGGRKGLHPGYIQYLIDTPAIHGIVYNSCSTKSLKRDLQNFIGSGAYCLADFQTYDFFSGCSKVFLASLALLVRRRPSLPQLHLQSIPQELPLPPFAMPPPLRTLILPIGPAGVGKTTLARQLAYHLNNNNPQCRTNSDSNDADNDVDAKSKLFLSWQRDEVFAQFRWQGLGLNKTKTKVHEHLMEFLIPHRRDRDDGLPSNSSNTPAIITADGDDDSDCLDQVQQQPPLKEANHGHGSAQAAYPMIMYVDSTNGNADARTLYMEVSNADLVILVEMRPHMAMTMAPQQNTSQSDNDGVDNENGKDGESSHEEGTSEAVLQWLLHRTADRLEGGPQASLTLPLNNTTATSHAVPNHRNNSNRSNHHPSFPLTLEEQRIKHENIVMGLEYPSSNNKLDQEGEKANGRRATVKTVLLRCNPVMDDESSQSSSSTALGYDIFVELLVSSDTLKELLVPSRSRRRVIMS
jgi:hypothetical protein